MLANFSVALTLRALVSTFLEENQVEPEFLSTFLNKQPVDERLPITEWWQALAALSARTEIPHVGIELGKLAKPSHGGALGYLVQTSTNVAEALTDFVAYQRVLYEGASANIKVSDKELLLTWPLDYGYSTKESDETLIAGLVSFIRNATGDMGISPNKVNFIHQKPEDVKPYLDFFQCEVAFGSDCTEISFSLTLANIPMLNADPVLNEILRAQVKRQLRDMPESDVFMRWFYQHLISAMPMGEANVPAIARKMMMSPRTLSRRLEEKEVKFNTVLADTRCKLAKQYLNEAKLSHVEITNQLGYSEQSAFSRAFKSWTGISPRQFQSELADFD